MDAEVGKLTMVNRGKTTEEICPKCHAAQPGGARECPNCGVIYNKIKSSTSGSNKDARVIPTPPAATVNPKILDELDKRKKLCGVLLFLCIAGAGFYYLYISSFIGTKIFDPGKGGIFMTEDDYDAMVESVSDKTIAQFVESMDFQQQDSM